MMNPMKKTLKGTPSYHREHARYGIASLAEVHYLESGVRVDGLVSNVSRGGIAIYTEEPLKTGQNVRVKISFLQTNGNQEITEVIPGRVLWTKPLHNHYVVGIAFTSLDEHRHAVLLQNLEYAAKGEA
jgi:Tfp pilus assembly protein PilZ